ncbi:class I SAM-dependent DNA methyltransferase [Paractinoplanes lichenicola]|uniref:Methyltransferase domain-containing protein n=1 Tax=Paractinoplanes lichenicola TaxID=2802976 RepID=A0ABS1VNX1_9ACTN|nr:class I SAM-dependent methyltransferase [Actinoplanes lichenicola]MBL7256432.1 methyltransferase domain-containing protein [Actinoplanes lichenicola]
MSLLDEQRAYYEARAGEYDEWWYRQGRYALAPDERERWLTAVAFAERTLDEFRPSGDVLEFACGTGLWTRHLARHAGTVLAVDASPAMIDCNRARRLGDHVRYRQADIFAWAPRRPPSTWSSSATGCRMFQPSSSQRSGTRSPRRSGRADESS